MCVEYKVIPKNGHWEGFVDGVFVCSGDTFHEAVVELEKHIFPKKEDE